MHHTSHSLSIEERFVPLVLPGEQSVFMSVPIPLTLLSPRSFRHRHCVAQRLTKGDPALFPGKPWASLHVPSSQGSSGLHPVPTRKDQGVLYGNHCERMTLELPVSTSVGSPDKRKLTGLYTHSRTPPPPPCHVPGCSGCPPSAGR